MYSEVGNVKEYIKIDVSLWDKILFLLFGIIEKKNIINTIETIETSNKMIEPIIYEHKKKLMPVDTKMEYEAPLFFNDTDKVESNL